MAKFNCSVLDERDAHGKLDSIGLIWIERTPICYLLYTLMSVFVLVALLMFAFSLKTGRSGSAYFFAYLAGLSFVAGWLFGTRVRSMTFTSDGAIHTESGLPFERSCRILRFGQDVITTFEIHPWSNEYLVNLHTRGGDTVAIARGLVIWDARKVAVQLGNLLRDMRDSRGSTILSPTAELIS